MKYIPRYRARCSELCAIYAHCTEMSGMESWLAVRASPEYRLVRMQRLRAVTLTETLTVPIPTFPAFRPTRCRRVFRHARPSARTSSRFRIPVRYTRENCAEACLL